MFATFCIAIGFRLFEKTRFFSPPVRNDLCILCANIFSYSSMIQPLAQSILLPTSVRMALASELPENIFIGTLNGCSTKNLKYNITFDPLQSAMMVEEMSIQTNINYFENIIFT